jgi:hypothetical protein
MQTKYVRHDDWETLLDGLDCDSADLHAYFAKCESFEWRGVRYQKLGRPTPKPAAKAPPSPAPEAAPAPVTPISSASERIAKLARETAERAARGDDDPPPQAA